MDDVFNKNEYAMCLEYAIKSAVVYLHITSYLPLHICVYVYINSVDLVINMDMPKVASDYIHRYTLYTLFLLCFTL